MAAAQLDRLARLLDAARDAALARLRAAQAEEDRIGAARAALAARARSRAACTEPALRAALDGAWDRYVAAESRRLNTLLSAARAQTGVARAAALRATARADAAARLVEGARAAEAARRAAASVVLAQNVEHEDIVDIGAKDRARGLP
jgi:hypothetical protein